VEYLNRKIAFLKPFLFLLCEVLMEDEEEGQEVIPEFPVTLLIH
jgi:hypothetical protein